MAGVLLAVIVGTVAGAASVAAPASAHAQLVGTAPAGGEHLAAAPTEIRLRFSEAVNLVRDGVTLLDSDGVRRDTRPAGLDASHDVVLPVPTGLADGVYTVSWRVVSADSHPVHGAFVFSIGTASTAGSTATTSPDGDPALGVVFWLFRLLGYAALAVLTGGVVFLTICWRAVQGQGWHVARRVLVVAWATSVVCAVAMLLLQGPYGAGGSLAGVADLDLVRATLATDYGRYILARLAALAIGGTFILLLGQFRYAWYGAVAALAVVLPATWTGTGHAHAQPGLLPAFVDTVHLIAMSAWFGGLVFLVACVLPRSADWPEHEVARALTRFSPLAMISVGVLVCTGIYQAWRGLGSLAALPGSSYGALLVFKLAVIGVLLWFGALSRASVQRRYVRPALAKAPVPALDATPAPQLVRTGKAARTAGARGTPPDRVGATTSSRTVRRAARAQHAEDLQVRQRLRRSVRVEVIVAVVVLGLTSVLVATPPGARADTAPLALTPSVFRADLPLRPDGLVRLELDPARVGTGQVRITVLDANGTNRDVPEVTATMTLPSRSVGPLPVPLKRTGPGSYTSDSVAVPLAGTWSFAVSVRTTEIDVTTVRTDIPIH
jgi:copper transport protein